MQWNVVLLPVILLVERINLCKPRMIFMLLCTWFQKETFAGDLWNVKQVILKSA